MNVCVNIWKLGIQKDNLVQLINQVLEEKTAVSKCTVTEQCF